MASLMEELIATLKEENRLYQELIPIAEKKTQIIVENDLPSLSSITEKEQMFVTHIGKLERKRQEVVRNIGIVMNRRPEELNFKTIIEMLKGQTGEQKELRELHDEMKRTVERLGMLNDRNQVLVKQSLEMIEFDINLLQSMRTSPVMGQYNQTSEVDISGSRKSVFDTKQ